MRAFANITHAPNLHITRTQLINYIYCNCNKSRSTSNDINANIYVRRLHESYLRDVAYT